jgi:hypothetical protein
MPMKLRSLWSRALRTASISSPRLFRSSAPIASYTAILSSLKSAFPGARLSRAADANNTAHHPLERMAQRPCRSVHRRPSFPKWRRFRQSGEQQLRERLVLMLASQQQPLCVKGPLDWSSACGGVSNRREFRELQKPTFGSTLEHICNVFIGELRGVTRLPILLNVGHNCSVTK